MSEEHLYIVDGPVATPAERVSLTSAGMLERKHLQEWVIAHPEILGEDVLIITFEFDRWMTGAGSPTWERLDVLAVDRTGRLVVAELKRDVAPDAVMVQALNYAAMASRFTVDLLVDAYAARCGRDAASGVVLDELREWAPALSDESLGPPRIVLVAEDFGAVLRNTALFLIEQGLELRLVRVQLYRLANESLALTASQLLPVPDTEAFMVRPRSSASTQRDSRAAATRRSSIPDRLVAAGVFADGDVLRIVVPDGVVEDRETISSWLAGDADRAHVRWRQDAREPAVWAVDSVAYNLTTLIRHIIEQATGEPARTQVWGPNWYRTDDGEVLHKVAERLTDPSGGRFDWSGLHAVLRSIPVGLLDDLWRPCRADWNGGAAARRSRHDLRRVLQRMAGSGRRWPTSSRLRLERPHGHSDAGGGVDCRRRAILPWHSQSGTTARCDRTQSSSQFRRWLVTVDPPSAGVVASDVNTELTVNLVEVGRRMGFASVTEFAVPGGRLDVVWLWDPPAPIPGVVGAIPVVGFEIESSWRTRKHVKGDLLNLQDAGVALGVIVLAGADARDESLRRFALSLIERPGATILVWTHDDVRALAASRSIPTQIETAAAEMIGLAEPVSAPGAGHNGKYRPLWEWLRLQESREIRVSFDDLELHAGIVLPDSCRAHPPHWYSYQGSAVARAIIDAGWHASRVDLNAMTVSLVPGPPSGRDGAATARR